jgi:hypothetical protein
MAAGISRRSFATERFEGPRLRAAPRALLALAGISFRPFGWNSAKDSHLLVVKHGRRQRIEFVAAGLAELPQEVQRGALRHRAQLWQGLVR